MDTPTDMQISVILPAAGQSRRFRELGGKTSKLETELAGRIVLVRAVELFSGRPEVKQIIVAVDPDEIDTFRFRWGDKLGFLGVQIVAGGKAERWETVMNAMAEVKPEATHVAVHDAARPVTPSDVIDRVFEAAGRYDAVIPAAPVSATVKRAEPVEADDAADPLDAILGDAGKPKLEVHRITDTVPRAGLWLAQTPQVFRRDLLQRAYEQVRDGQLDSSTITDDAGLIEAMGEPVHLVAGDAMNVKITAPTDVLFAEAVLAVTGGRPAGDDPLGPKRKFPTWAEMEDE